MSEKKLISHELRVTGNKMKRRAEASIPPEIKCSVTPVQGRVIGYLYRNRDRDVFQRDVEEIFSITRATASAMLSAMERGGLIIRRGVERDARLKKLELTDSAVCYHQQIWQGIQEFEAMLTQGLSAEEKETLLHLLRKVEANIDDGGDGLPCCREGSEGSTQ